MKEEDVKHGALKENKLVTKIKRALRPKHHALGGAPVPFDWTVGVETNCKIKNQGQSESCGGQSGGKWVEVAVPKQLEVPQAEVSAKSIYSQGFYPNGGGMYESSLTNIISNGQYALEADVPSYDTSGNPLTEEQYRDTSWGKAFSNKKWVKVTVNIDKQSIAEAINSTGGVIWRIEGQNGNIPSWTSSTPVPPLQSNPNALWGHYMCVTGAKSSYPKPIRADQSWGDGIGDQGRQYFDDDYIKSGYITDAFTFVPQVVFDNKNIPLMQRILARMQSLYSSLFGG